jgi:type II secretory pathway predicted ATPase ExeA
MLRLAAQGMGIATEEVEKAQLLERIEQHLEDEARSGKRTLLIVDEAQNLPVSALEELRMLSNYQKGGRAFLQIFLLGQPEFRDKLASSESLEQLRQRVIATHHLEPMGENEIEGYVTHRLAQAGAAGRPEIDAEAYAEIYRQTGGVPRRVNQFVGRLLLYGAVEQLDAIGADAVAAVAADLSADARSGNEAQRASQRRSFSPATPGEQDDPALERRVAALEARLEEQEAALRRVLTLLVDWVESDSAPVSYRHNAA